MDTTQLVERCRRGENEAINLLYTLYAPKMMQVCRKYVKSAADVQDIVHDIFIVILTSLDRLKEPKKLESWMCTIVCNLSLKHVQQPSLVRMEHIELAGETQSETTEIPDYEQLMAMMEQLPKGYRSVLKLSVLEGLSHKEISELLNIEPHSSSSQLVRAKELMRKKLRSCATAIMSFFALILPFLFDDDNDLTDDFFSKK